VFFRLPVDLERAADRSDRGKFIPLYHLWEKLHDTINEAFWT
jgi:hypothetical protein